MSKSVADVPMHQVHQQAFELQTLTAVVQNIQNHIAFAIEQIALKLVENRDLLKLAPDFRNFDKILCVESMIKTSANEYGRLLAESNILAFDFQRFVSPVLAAVSSPCCVKSLQDFHHQIQELLLEVNEEDNDRENLLAYLDDVTETLLCDHFTRVE